MFQAIKADPRYYLVMAIIRGIYMPATLWLSFNHIIGLGHMTGLTGSQAYVAPFLVDGFAVMGMVFRSFEDHSLKVFGVWMQAVAGLASLGANVAAGHSLGERVFGALVVVAFVVAEQAGHVMAKAKARRQASTTTPAAVEVREVIREVIVEVPVAPVVDEAAAKREAANAKRRFNAAVKREVAKALEAKADQAAVELAEMAAGFVPADAPVSPALPTTYL
jgi:hypothetical protein